MSNSTITKRALASSLKECMAEKPLEKISIGEICAKCDLNRKSFYYHFRDKFELVNWIYDTEINDKVNGCLKTMSTKDIAMMICQYLFENRTFYLNALEVSGPHSFHDYFCRQIQPIVDKTLHASSDDSLDLEELSDVIGDFCLSAVRRWIGHPNPATPEKFLENLTNVSVTLCGRMLSVFL